MDGRLQKLAMEQMSRMTPEQLAQIKNQMGNVSPAAMQRMQQRMSTMSSAEIDRIEKKMQNTDPSSIPSISSTVQARQAYAYDVCIFPYAIPHGHTVDKQASLSLKNEGNTLFKNGNYMAAVAKYERARDNLTLCADKRSCELIVSCLLNMAMCYLKLELYSECIRYCAEVLKDDSKNVKALYRRGQAYMHQKKYPEALVDLRQTLQLKEGDAVEQQLIQEKIDEVVRQLAELEISPAKEDKVIGAVEEIPVEEVSPRVVDRETEAWRRSAEAVENMTDEEICQMSKMTGLDVSPEMVRTAHSAMKDADPETLTQMSNLAKKLNASQSESATQSAGSSSATYHLNSDNVDLVSDMFQSNPDLVKTQAETMKNMSQEELDRLSRAAGYGQGLKLTPEIVQKAADSISSMDMDQLKNLPRMARQTQERMSAVHADPSSSTASPAPPTVTETGKPAISPEMMDAMGKVMENMSPDDIASMQQMMASGTMPTASSLASDPKTIHHTLEMLKSMDEETVVQMIRSSGMCADEDRARGIVRQMRGMSPRQMEMLAKAAGFAQRSSEVTKKIKQWLRSRAALICALCIIVIGVILRVYEIM